MFTFIYDNGYCEIRINNQIISSFTQDIKTNLLKAIRLGARGDKQNTYNMNGLISNLFIGEYKDKNGNVIWTDEYIKYVYKNNIRFNIGSNF
jgi:hypothetical protein